MGLTRPRRLGAEDDLSSFCCGESAIDGWFHERARKTDQSGAARVYVVCDGSRVIAFYTLSASCVVRERVALRDLKKNSPELIPVVLLGQLGVDRTYHRKGIAHGLVKDALIRALSMSASVGVIAVLVDALTPGLMPFYRQFGFDPVLRDDSTVLIVRIKDVTGLYQERGST